jgi:hypothetical protein
MIQVGRHDAGPTIIRTFLLAYVALAFEKSSNRYFDRNLIRSRQREE